MNKPGMIIGYRKNGCPIRLIAGGSGEGEPDGGTDAPTDASDASGEPDGTEPDGDADEGADALRDAGKQALDRMKTQRNTERDRRKAAEAKVAELEAKLNPPKQDDKPDAAAIQREAEAKANQRILKAEVKAAAAGKLADPTDALTMIDLSQFEVGPDGDVDADEIAGAIDELLTRKPYLSAQGGRRFQGSADGGARKGNREGAQLTKADLEGMSPEQIVKAQNEGRLNNLLGITK